MAELLKHPLIILFAGALISGLLIPAITRQWQNHQKALEIKTQLVSELSKTIMEIIIATQFAHLRAVSQQQADFDKAYREWEIQSSVIGTKLQAYFPDTTIPEEWTDFSEIVTYFYALEGVHENQRSASGLTIAEKLGLSMGPEYRHSQDWVKLKNGLLNRKSELIQRVLRTDISVLR